MRLKLKGDKIIALSGLENNHQLALRARVSHPTVVKYINTPEQLESVDLRILANLLIDGCRISPDEFMDMKLSDLFDLVDDPGS